MTPHDSRRSADCPLCGLRQSYCDLAKTKSEEWRRDHEDAALLLAGANDPDLDADEEEVERQ